MKFINRNRELKALEERFPKAKPEFIIIYGKRRIGKTEIIKQFIKNKPAIYFLAKRTSEKDNLFSLGNIIGKFFKDRLLIEHGYHNWPEVFSYLKEKIKRRTVLIFDEFPYLAEANKGISSIFQAGWDEYLKETPVFLIICGSSIAMMEMETLAYKAPLYGRRTGQLFVKPMPFFEATKFFPGADFEDSLRFYSVAGGNPAYLLKLTDYSSLEEAIKKEILTPEEFLYQEVEFILKEELRQPRNYFSILKAIAFNRNKVSEIINETGLEKSALHNYLFVLEDLHLIEKEVSVTEKKPRVSRKGRYYLKDQFFKFWFNYCFPFINELELGNQSSSLREIRKSFALLVTGNYEKVSFEILHKFRKQLSVIRQKRGKRSAPLFDFQRVGRWWDKNEEIDLVAINEETNEILFGEAKWSNKLVGTNIYEELKRKSKKVVWGKKNRKEYFTLFSKSGFTPQMSKVAKREGVYLFHQDKLIL